MALVSRRAAPPGVRHSIGRQIIMVVANGSVVMGKGIVELEIVVPRVRRGAIAGGRRR